MKLTALAPLGERVDRNRRFHQSVSRRRRVRGSKLWRSIRIRPKEFGPVKKFRTGKGISPEGRMQQRKQRNGLWRS